MITSDEELGSTGDDFDLLDEELVRRVDRLSVHALVLIRHFSQQVMLLDLESKYVSGSPQRERGEGTYEVLVITVTLASEPDVAVRPRRLCTVNVQRE